MRNKYENNYIVTDATAEDDKLLMDYFLKGKLHPEFLPMTTYDMIQTGYPEPDHGAMVVRVHGGTDENDVLQPSNGKWIKVEDFMTYLKLTNGMEGISRVNTTYRPLEIPKVEKEPKKKKTTKTKKKKGNGVQKQKEK